MPPGSHPPAPRTYSSVQHVFACTPTGGPTPQLSGASVRQRDELRDRHLGPVDRAMGLPQCRKVVVKELQELRPRGPAAEIAAGQLGDRLVIGPVIRGVGVAAAGKPADVPIELRADVIQLMHKSVQFFLEWQIEEPRQIDRQDIPLLTGTAVQPLNRPGLAISNSCQLAALKTEWRELR